jgi:hypothetical protein
MLFAVISAYIEVPEVARMKGFGDGWNVGNSQENSSIIIIL